MSQDKGGTHEQRRRAKQVKDEWCTYIVSGDRTLTDLVKAAQGESQDAKYLSSILLVDLVSRVHPGLTRSQVVAELEPLPIKLPADPARFSIRSIRSRPELVTQVQAMLQSSEVTKNARGRTRVPTNWPWTTKLSDLIRLNAGEVPQTLEWLEMGGGDDDEASDALLSGPELTGAFTGDAAVSASPVAGEVEDVPEPQGDDAADPEEDPVEAMLRQVVAEKTAGTAGEAEPEAKPSAIADAFGDIFEGVQ